MWRGVVPAGSFMVEHQQGVSVSPPEIAEESDASQGARGIMLRFDEDIHLDELNSNYFRSG
jgi:hypothetical protein